MSRGYVRYWLNGRKEEGVADRATSQPLVKIKDKAYSVSLGRILLSGMCHISM
jgi:hypothetical protein